MTTPHPWMPLYIADFPVDTLHLDAALTGAYVLLIMHYWQNGGLPTDDKSLMHIARMLPAQWKRARPILAAFFHDGWKHKRIDKELNKTNVRAASGRAGGIASGKVRSKIEANGEAKSKQNAKQSGKQTPKQTASKSEQLHTSHSVPN